MILLIHYDRRAQRLLRFDRYEDAQRQQAEDDRLELELSLLNSDRENEIVLLKGASEEALRESHARYFLSFSGLVDAARKRLSLS